MVTEMALFHQYFLLTILSVYREKTRQFRFQSGVLLQSAGADNRAPVRMSQIQRHGYARAEFDPAEN